MARTQTHTFTSASIAGGGSLNVNRTGLPDYFNISKVKVTADSGGGSFDFQVYKKDTFLAADLLAFWNDATSIYDPMDNSSGTPAEALEGAPIPYEDLDATGELHLRFVNNDSSSHTYTVTVLYEEVPLMSAAGASTWRAGATFAGALTGITNLTMTGTLTMGTSQAINATTSLLHQIGGTTVFTTDAGGITLGTSLAIDGTTSVLQQIGGTTVGTWSATGLDLVKTAGNLTFSAITSTSGLAIGDFRGLSTNTTITSENGGVNLYLGNQNPTSGNYSAIYGRDAGPQVTSGIAFINDVDATNQGSLAIMTRPASGSLTEVVRFLSTGNVGIGRNSNALSAAGEIARLSLQNPSSAGGILELVVATNTDNTQSGTIQFVNESNANSSNSGAVDYMGIAQIQTRMETTDGNAGADSGGHLVFSTKVEAGLLTARGAILSGGQWIIGNSTTAPTNMTVGLSVVQAGNDDLIFSANSSDVTHVLTSAGLLSQATGDFFVMAKRNAAEGGVTLQASAEDAAISEVFRINAYGGTADATKSTAGLGLITLYASEHDGANALADIAADGNIVVFRCRRGGADVTTHIFDEDGDSHEDGTGWTAYDDHDDLSLLNALDHTLDRRFHDPLRSDFMQWMREKEHALSSARIVTFNENGHHFVNKSRLSMLHTGAIRQIGARVESIEEKCARYEHALLSLGVKPEQLMLE